MTTTVDRGAVPAAPVASEHALTRLSARFGIAFTACQLLVMIAMAVFVLPGVGAPGDPAAERGQAILDVETAYRVSNYAFMVAGTMLLGFLGAVHVRLRRVDPSGVLSTVAVAAGTMLALVWPLAGVLHDVAMGAAAGRHRRTPPGGVGRRRAVLARVLGAAAALPRRGDRAGPPHGRGGAMARSGPVSCCCR